MDIIQRVNKSINDSIKFNQLRMPAYSIPNVKDFHTKINKLEAVVLLMTSREINNGSFSKFIKILLNVTHEKSNIDFIISVNNNDHTSIENEIEKLKLFFKNVYYYNINIDKKSDIYMLDHNNLKYIPKYGLASGPNILFLTTMKKLKAYNTVLTLETDCILYENWLNTLINYVEYGGDFLISGSTYDGGDHNISKNSTIGKLHINGVALYRTESKVFHFLLDYLDHYIQFCVARKTLFTAYDFALCQLIFDNIDTSTKQESTFWKIVYRYTTKNSFIINASMEFDRETPESIFLHRFPKCVVLHKKSITSS
jgi:hypothetical protein